MTKNPVGRPKTVKSYGRPITVRLPDNIHDFLESSPGSKTSLVIEALNNMMERTEMDTDRKIEILQDILTATDAWLQKLDSYQETETEPHNKKINSAYAEMETLETYLKAKIEEVE